MTVSRKARLEALLADDPSDQFLRYGLALELEKEGDHAGSLKLLSALQTDAVPYLAAYFRAGQQLTRLARIDEARAVLRDGIELARTRGDSHAAGEMSEFLASLGSLGE
jgi:hypothetical protein